MAGSSPADTVGTKQLCVNKVGATHPDARVYWAQAAESSGAGARPDSGDYSRVLLRAGSEGQADELQSRVAEIHKAVARQEHAQPTSSD
jgi:hypothetical protein